MKRWERLALVFLGSACISLPAAVGEERFIGSDPATRDPALEGRLSRMTVYKTQAGDTLAGVAHLLWGHKTWWRRFKADNPRLRGYGPEQRLAPGIRIRYRAPAVDEEYIVQKNDWLIRIVQWKYGSTDAWEEIYRKNSKTIEDPNLIRPGDRLVLGSDGTVKNAKTGLVVVRGLRGAEPERRPPETSVASLRPDPFALGVSAGVLLLLAWSWRKRRPGTRGPGRDGLGKFPFTFKNRPLDPLTPDLSPLERAEDGDVDRRPNYHSLIPRKPRRLR